MLQAQRPSLLLLGDDPPDFDILELCRRIRGLDGGSFKALPLLVVSDNPDFDRSEGSEAGISDWFVNPFSTVYARTRLRTWLLRQCLH